MGSPALVVLVVKCSRQVGKDEDGVKSLSYCEQNSLVEMVADCMLQFWFIRATVKLKIIGTVVGRNGLFFCDNQVCIVKSTDDNAFHVLIIYPLKPYYVK